MSDPQGATFDTAIGRCAVVWNEAGLVAVSLPALPQADATAALWARLRRRHRGLREAAPPPPIHTVIDGIVALLRGERVDLSGAPIDWRGVPDFHRQVYRIALRIPPGTTMTYGEVAHRLGDSGAARAVGQALGRNPWPVVVPCHRVLAADGRIGGFSAPGGAATKLRLLEIERAWPGGQPSLFDDA